MNAKETIRVLATGELTFTAYAADQLQAARLTDLALDVGRTCSLKCSGMCYRADRTRASRADEYVSIERVISEIREAEKCGLTNLTISGTEPFLYLDDDAESTRLATQRTYDIIEGLGPRPRSFRLGLVSNGLDIHRHWDWLEGQSRRGHLDYIDLSIDSSDPLVHDRIRGRKGAGAAVLTALREANRQLESVRVSSSSVLRPDNAAGLLRLIEEQAPFNQRFFITPIQPTSTAKGVRPVKTEIVVQFARDLFVLLGCSSLMQRGIEVTFLVTGLYIHDLIQAGFLTWDEVSDDLSVTREVGGNTLRFQLAVLPEYGLSLGLLEFTGNYLPHAHALLLPHESRGEWVVGNIADTSLLELHARGVRGLIQRLIAARDAHDCHVQPCWSTCFGGLAFNAEDVVLQRAPLTSRPTACVRQGSTQRRLPVVL